MDVTLKHTIQWNDPLCGYLYAKLQDKLKHIKYTLLHIKICLIGNFKYIEGKETNINSFFLVFSIYLESTQKYLINKATLIKIIWILFYILINWVFKGKQLD